MWDQKEYKAGDNPAFFILIIINNKYFLLLEIYQDFLLLKNSYFCLIFGT